MGSAFVPGSAQRRAAFTTTGNLEDMDTRDEPSRACARCQSTKTIRTLETLDRESWYCFACRRGFDVRLRSESQKPQRRAGDRKRVSSR
jgi:hypothetical protein